MSAHFTYHAQGRSLRAAVIVLVIWLGLLFLWLRLDAHPVIIAGLALFTLPACWDFVTDPASGLTLSDDTLNWYSGKRRAEVALAEIAHLRLDTRLDFSVRASVVLHTGRRIRLPFESTPPYQAFEDALQARGIKTLRFHFQLFQ